MADREAWLLAAADKLRPLFVGAGIPLPEKIYISVGLPKGRKFIGECWHGEASEDGNKHVFISPVLREEAEVLDTLVHELVHVVMPSGVGHKAAFVKAGALVGLNEGKPKSLGAGPALKGILTQVAEELGPFPHSRLDTSTMKKAQTTRMLKAECPSCGYTVRLAKKWLEYAGPPFCPAQECRADDRQMVNISAEEEEA